jgi:hypothetical protein
MLRPFCNAPGRGTAPVAGGEGGHVDASGQQPAGDHARADPGGEAGEGDRLEAGAAQQPVQLLRADEQPPVVGAPRHHAQHLLQPEHGREPRPGGAVDGVEDEAAAGGEHPGQLGHGRREVGQVLEHVGGDHGVEVAVGEREPFQPPLDRPEGPD